MAAEPGAAASGAAGERVAPPYFEFMQAALALLQAHPGHVLQLEPTAYERFACSGCGLCCQRPWSVAIDRDYYERMHATLSAQPGYADPFVLREQPEGGHYASIRTKPGTSECLFLLDDRRCFIQASYGEAALPEGCRSFPRYQSWFGAFIGRFMLTSCPDVHALNFEDAGILCRVVRLSPEQLRHFASVRHPLGQAGAHLWLGLQLDLLRRPLSPIQALRLLGQGLGALLPDPARVSREQLTRLHRQLQAAAAPQPVSGGLAWLDELLAALPDARAWLSELASGWRSPPRLSAADQALLAAFVRSYLAYRLLSAPAGAFWQFYLLLARQVALLQWLALYYHARAGGPLAREQLLRAATVIGYRFEQNPGLARQLQSLSPQACLAGMAEALSFDFTAGPT